MVDADLTMCSAIALRIPLTGTRSTGPHAGSILVALALLAASEFKGALAAGVPDGIRVAHKYGVHNLTNDRLFHDCGIVYHPLRPYMLCVMTRGNDLDSNIRFIADVSKRVYEQVQQNTSKSW
jgi:beta-lactamase class A